MYKNNLCFLRAEVIQVCFKRVLYYSHSMFVYSYVDEKFIANTFNSQCMKDYYLCGKKKSEEVFQLSPILYA